MDKTDRRKEGRYICSGRVTMNPIPGAIHRGRIVNISLGGCLIELQSPLSLSRNSLVELTIQAKGIGLRVQGNVMAARRRAPACVSISFSRLSSRSSFALHELIGELVWLYPYCRHRVTLRKLE